jgi:hypothetical protein
MTENMLLYSLLFTSIFNLILLFVLAVAIVRMGSIVRKLSLRVSGFLEKGEKEIESVGGALKGAISKSDQYTDAAVKMSERYLAYKAISKAAVSPKASKYLTVLGIGYGLYRFWSRTTQNAGK